MTDHHDFGFDDHHDEPMPFDDHGDPGIAHVPEHDDWVDHDEWPAHAEWAGHDDRHDGDPAGHDGHPGDAEADPAPAAEPVATAEFSHDDPLDVFPPALDVGDLPEPVDGFPWIDPGSLGVADPAALTGPHDPVDPQELAAYAGEDLPPGEDPWQALAGSEDPATSTLAKWWQQD